MISEMANVARECLTTPTRDSIWSLRLQRYVCIDTLEGQQALRDHDQSPGEALAHPALGRDFKLIVVVAIVATLVFASLCVVLTFLSGREPAPLFDRMMTWLMDGVKVTGGAVLGLLGGRARNSNRVPRVAKVLGRKA
jgi:hypothetical protein